MRFKHHLILLFVLFFSSTVFAQENNADTDSLTKKVDVSIERPLLDSARVAPKATVTQPKTGTTTIKSTPIDSLFHNVEVRVDTVSFSFIKDLHTYLDESHLFIEALTPSPFIAEIRLFVKDNARLSKARLKSSSIVDVLDSLSWVNERFYRARIRINDFKPEDFPSLIFEFQEHTEPIRTKIVRLYPYQRPSLVRPVETIELFEGEERAITIPGMFFRNIRMDTEWAEVDGLSYRFQRESQQLTVQLKANFSGQRTVELPLRLVRPILSDSLTIITALPPLRLSLNVRPTRLQFINPDKSLLFYQSDDNRNEEVTINFNRSFQLRRTYRIETQQDGGGRLVAELVPKSVVGDRILCDIIPYSLHQASDGYLYIKDRDKAIFVTSFSITNRPRIERIHMLRQSGEWNESLRARPGERVELRVEGRGLEHVDLRFENCESRVDSLKRSNRTAFYQVNIPTNIQKRRVSLFMNNDITPYEIIIQEQQEPAQLDFVRTMVDGEWKTITDVDFNRPIFVDGTIRDVSFNFNRSAIDKNGKLYGIQYLDVEVKVLNAKNELMDVQTLNNIAIVPDESSFRGAFYDQRNAFNGNLLINDLLLRKTYNLPAFSQIVVTLRHTSSRYENTGYQRRITFINQRSYNFDVQIAFPAGLALKRFGEQGLGNLTGISTLALAQLSFYDQNQIGVFHPYKLGVGFLALNAFNFSDNPDIKRDVGIVAIGSFEPLRSNLRISIPLYMGIGYMISSDQFFAILGPGVQINF